MSYESKPPTTPFASRYPFPEDQIGYELNLRDGFALEFPDSAPVLEEALADVQRHAGIAIPKYKIREVLSADSPGPGDLNDELGYFTYTAHSMGYTRLMLRMPVTHTREEIDQMDDAQRAEASKTAEGFIVVGDIPPETSRMLNGIYSLIGAETLRDDRAAGQAVGTVVRRGHYQGTPVWIAEDYMNHSYYSGKPLFSVRLLGRETGEQAAVGLNEGQFQEFASSIGLDPVGARDTISANNVTVLNYQDVADVLRQSRKIVDAAVLSTGRKALGDAVDQVFIDLGLQVTGMTEEVNSDLLQSDRQSNRRNSQELRRPLRAGKSSSLVRRIGSVVTGRRKQSK